MSSWEFKKNLGNIGKWNKIFLSITCFWALLILTSPLMLDEGETGDLSGSVGIYDNKEIIQSSRSNLVSNLMFYTNLHTLYRFQVSTYRKTTGLRLNRSQPDRGG